MIYLLLALVAYLFLREVIFFVDKREWNKKQSELLDRLMSRDFEEYKAMEGEPEETKEDAPDFNVPISEIEDIDLVTNG